MKIGIITFHRANNYGAVLQCFALQEVLKQAGYNTYVINYKQPFIESNDRVFSFNKLKRTSKEPRKLIRYILNARQRIHINTSFNKFRNKYLNCTPICTAKTIPQNFDSYVIGSDQLWNIECTNKIDPVFMGQFAHTKYSSIYGYAISGNLKSLHQISDEDLKQYVYNFTQLSFREINLRNEVYEKQD